MPGLPRNTPLSQPNATAIFGADTERRVDGRSLIQRDGTLLSAVLASLEAALYANSKRAAEGGDAQTSDVGGNRKEREIEGSSLDVTRFFTSTSITTDPRPSDNHNYQEPRDFLYTYQLHQNQSMSEIQKHVKNFKHHLTEVSTDTGSNRTTKRVLDSAVDSTQFKLKFKFKNGEEKTDFMTIVDKMIELGGEAGTAGEGVKAWIDKDYYQTTIDSEASTDASASVSSSEIIRDIANT
ncbi:hypothetical protein P7C73_g6567, partial [Tremellales sp. Uapishka_1]